MDIPAPPVARRGHAALRRGRVSVPGQIYHLTAVTRDRSAYFAGFHVAWAAVRGFRQPAVLGDARLLAWVLMPDHAHWLLQLGQDPLDKVVSRMKSASGVHANRVLARSGPVWAPAFHDHALRREEDVRAAARYVVANPVRAGLVERAGDYPFWDCIWL
ncbi:MAG TPA: transposase [Pseudoxanthomonas sp.]|nr:transposase [Pseudoxanthomonas sp.]